MKRTLTIAALALASFTTHAASIVNSFGLAAPVKTVTFSELSFASNTLITNQFAAFGVTTTGHRYNSQTASGLYGIDGDFIGFSTQVPFVLSFGEVVTEAAFGYAKNPARALVEALLDGEVVEFFHQDVHYDIPNTAFLGFSGIAFDAIRVTAAGGGEGLVDNVQIGRLATNAVPEPGALALLLLAVTAAGVVGRARKRS